MRKLGLAACLIAAASAQAAPLKVATVISKDIERDSGAGALSIAEVYQSYHQVFTLKTVPTKTQVSSMCRQTMLSILKSPATTKFVSDAGVLYNLGSGTYIAGGTLDAQNSFGALLRNNYICNAIFVGTAKGGKFFVNGHVLDR